MLSATRRLIELLSSGDSPWKSSWTQRHGLVQAILQHGGPDDVPPLLDLFLRDPGLYEPLGPLMEHGDREVAARIFDRCLRDGALGEGVEPVALQALGYLGFEPARDVLLRHALGHGDYYEQKAAALGLLHLPLGEAAGRVRAGILGCRGKGLFAEFLPALAPQTGDAELLPLLIEIGSTTASTDCNGGLILGIALHGGAGREPFARLIDDRHWEADGPSVAASWLGLRLCGMTAAGLVRRLRALGRGEGDGLPDRKQLAHLASFALAMIRCRIEGRRWFVRAAEAQPPEPIEALYLAACDWPDPNRDSSLVATLGGWFGREDALTRRAQTLVALLEAALRAEIEQQAAVERAR